MADTYDISNLAKVSADGFTAASFPEIKNAYVEAMRTIYGSDIDVSDASADGQYVMMESLILNNIYRTLESLSDNLSIASASGTYLDVLSQLSGITRRDETYSTVNLIVTNTTDSFQKPDYLFFRDNAGNDWQWLNPVDYTSTTSVVFLTNVATAITATACKLGPIAAPEGTVFETVNLSGLQVKMEEGTSATLGQSRETDAELKTRRFRSLGQSGRTVIDSLQANLLNLSGMEDVWVFANNTGTQQTMIDNQEVASHDVYAVTYPQHNVNVPNAIVGEAIYNALTPGIKTPNVALNGKSLTIQVADAIETKLQWKQAPEQADVFHIYLKLTSAGETDNSLGSTAQKSQIKNSILTYLNNVRLGQQVDLQELAQIIQSVDFKTKKYGNATYNVAGITRNNEEGSETTIPGAYTLPLARYYYDDVTFSEDGKTITPQIKLKTPSVYIMGSTVTWTGNYSDTIGAEYKIDDGEVKSAPGKQIKITAGQTIQVRAIDKTTDTIYLPSDWSAPITYTGGN